MFVACCLLLQAVPLLAAARPPDILIGGRPTSCSPPPTVIDGEVFVPASFRFAGLPITASAAADTVTLHGPGSLAARVPCQTHEGTAYYPIAQACAGLRLGARWMPRSNKLIVAPKVDSIRPEVFDRLLTLRINAGYPVSAKVQVQREPVGLAIEIPDALLFADSTVIPVGQGGIVRVRAAQLTSGLCLVRIAVDTDAPPQFRALSVEATTQVRLRVAVPESTTPEAYAALDQLLDAPESDSGPVEVTAIQVDQDEEGNPRVVVRTSGPAKGQAMRLGSPPRVALDIANAAPRTEPPPVPAGVPLVQGIRLGQPANNVTRVVVDLLREADYTLTDGPEPGTLVLTLRAALKLLPALGLNGLRVMVDPGHGGSLAGTRGLTGNREQDINLDVAKRVYRLLEAAEARPSMTRFGDDTVGLRARPAMANAQRVSLFVSIHCNSNGRTDSARGIETFYCHSHSLRLARAIHCRLVRELGAPDRRIRYRPGLVVTRETKMPSILVEIGYMNHREEDRLLGTPEYRQRVAKAIFDGIAEYAGASGALESTAPAQEETSGADDKGPWAASDGEEQ